MNVITSTTEYSFPPSVVMLGKFDGVHLGHQQLIKTSVNIAKKECLAPIIYTFEGINAECLTTDVEKSDIFEGLGAKHVVFEKFTDKFKSISPEDFVKNILVGKLNARHIVVGFNYRFGRNATGDIVLLEKLCGEMKITLTVIPPFEVDGTLVSSTHIRRLLADGDVENAEKFLGRPYSISGVTAEGKGLGRVLGFATANLADATGKLLPKRGVYATKALAEGKKYLSMTNVGINPTVENIDKPKVETHIIDFTGELYGEAISIEFIDKIRGEKKFDSVDKLKSQLERDREYVKFHFGK